MDNDLTSGLGPEQLARVLAVGLDGWGGSDPRRSGLAPREILGEMLARKITSELATSDSLHALRDEMPDFGDSTLGELLRDTKADIAVIETLKNHAKKLVRRSNCEAEHAAATAIYYAGIAAAIVFHERKITRYSYGKLDQAFENLTEKPWIPSELKDLFAAARDLCNQRKHQLEQEN